MPQSVWKRQWKTEMEWNKVGGGHLPWQCWAGGFSHLVMVWPWPVCGALMYLQSVVLCPLPPPKHGARAAHSPPGSLYYGLIGMTGGEHSNLGGHHSGHSSHCLSVSTFFFFSSEKMETSSCRNINTELRLALLIHTYTHKALYRYTWEWCIKNTYTQCLTVIDTIPKPEGNLNNLWID